MVPSCGGHALGAVDYLGTWRCCSARLAIRATSCSAARIEISWRGSLPWSISALQATCLLQPSGSCTRHVRPPYFMRPSARSGSLGRFYIEERISAIW